ncbi:superoxide dismutase [Actinomadura spongiicola]|uniref:Superoxide dismutase n=1 Tax=Actinomadura spongiicola TaxID=2303421 RepID=A0A372GC70_9ACTN|nr:SMP-30/gluconolactonase/LRE family protein [Actinomadura spongiicola]RFS82719.1 superoxide dismutase [Actinomadura spongiicola]
MSRSRYSAALASALAVAVLPVAVPGAPVPTASAAVHGSASHARVSTAHVLPGDRVYPEGVAADPRDGTLYAGSYQDGTVYRMTPGRRVAEVYLPAGADGRRTANGLKVDRAGRLWVIDSTTGVSVYDARNRELLARFDVPGNAARFVNDLAIAPDGAAYLTDSIRSVVYRVTPRDLARARGGRATLHRRFDLGGVVEPHVPGTFTLNGVVADPTGRFLLVADMHGGDLYRLDLATGAARKTVLHGGDLRNADGLELQHGRLWVVHNIDNAISRWRVAPAGDRARRERVLTDASLQLPTTLVRRHGTLYVVRSQFDKGGPLGGGTPEIPFTIAAVRGV